MAASQPFVASVADAIANESVDSDNDGSSDHNEGEGFLETLRRIATTEPAVISGDHEGLVDIPISGSEDWVYYPQ